MKIKTLFLAIPLAFTALCLTSGCRTFTLPEVQGESLVYHSSNPLGGTSIEATGVRVTKTFIKAESASWTTTYPQWTVHLAVKGYKQRRDKPDNKVSEEEEKP